MKKTVVISGGVLLIFGIVFFIWHYFHAMGLEKEKQKEKEQFDYIQKLNIGLFEKLPDSTIFQISGFTYEMKYERAQYQKLIGKQYMDEIYDAIKHKKIYDIFLKTDKFGVSKKSDVYCIYTVKKEPLFIKDFRVTQYIYFKGGNLTKNKLERMETIYKFEEFKKIKDTWYKVVYIENSGRSFNL